MATTVVDVMTEPFPLVQSANEGTPPYKKYRGGVKRYIGQKIQRVSSSSSLPYAGRSHSSSASYGLRANLSCVSLTPAATFAPTPSGSVTPSSAHGSQTSNSALESCPIRGREALLAPRQTLHRPGLVLVSTKAYLPSDVTLVRSRSRLCHNRPRIDFSSLPDEVRLMILSHLKAKELVRVSRVSKEFHRFCFDGQLWTCFDTSDFYSSIPPESLAQIISTAGPFIKNLNLRGCLQFEEKRAEVLVTACKNLVNASLEGCRTFRGAYLHDLFRSNNKLVTLNLTSLSAVTNSTCKIISQHCPQLESLNVSWCKSMDAKGIKMVVLGCSKLKDLRAGEIKGFNRFEVAKAIFKTNNLERLVLSGCSDLTDDVLKTIIHGSQPEMDILTDRPIVPPRKLRHLDLSRCQQLTDRGIMALSHLVPDLEGLQLNGCFELTDASLSSVVVSTPQLTRLEVEELSELTDDFFSRHLATAPCAIKLQRLSVSYCESVGNFGLLPVIKNCVSLRSVDMDNTRIDNAILAEAADMLSARADSGLAQGQRPRVGLRLVVYDCAGITWQGVYRLMSLNTELRKVGDKLLYPAEVVGLKCYWGWQQTVEKHMKWVLKSDFAAAERLQANWKDYMTAVDRIGTRGISSRRRRRLARQAGMLHEDDEGESSPSTARRRARTLGESCAIM
ncbi:RNI-like protein [Astrocystis sublimbata]|nr:RNI-like protein [Astrocystis sublimbata]